MIRIAAVDDEMHALEMFERIALKIKDIEICGLFETGEQLLSYLKLHSLDAVFLDIEMPGISGLQLSEQVLDLDENIDIIFVTAFNQYAVEAFELQAMDYIMKPLAEERFAKTVARLLKTKRMVQSPNKPFIQCFGSFEVFINGEAMPWKNSKAKEILAFLIQKNGIPVNWEKITNAVWPDYDAEKAQTNFHATTYLLRKRLSEVGISNILENSRGNYRVVMEELSCDLYKLKEHSRGKKIKGKQALLLIEQFGERGYMEGDGYAWSYPKAAELDEIFRKTRGSLKK